MGQQITSRHRSPVGTKFSTSKRPFPGVSPEAASGGGGGGAGAPSPAMGDRQLLSRHPSPKGMVFGSSSRPGPADVRLTREEPGPGAYLRARSISMGRQALSRVRTAPQAKFGTSTRPPLRRGAACPCGGVSFCFCVSHCPSPHCRRAPVPPLFVLGGAGAVARVAGGSAAGPCRAWPASVRAQAAYKEFPVF